MCPFLITLMVMYVTLVNKSLSPGELVDLVSVDTVALSRSQPEHSDDNGKVNFVHSAIPTVSLLTVLYNIIVILFNKILILLTNI